MARARNWESLSPGYRARLSRNGISKRLYESGKNLSVARGHRATPEHPRDAVKHPERYRKYVDKRERKRFKGTPTGPTPEDIAYETNKELDNAFRNFDARLGHYYKYKRATVLANVYGGVTSESGEVPGMSREEARWTSQADEEEIRSRASEQYRGNPWWYH